MKCVLVGFLVMGFSAWAELTVSPSMVMFGSVPLNTSESQQVDVENTGSSEVLPSLMNECPADFSVTNFCELELQPYEDCTIEVQFEPHTSGIQTCSLWLTDANADDVNISVQGNSE
jgi:hypothetical protein